MQPALSCGRAARYLLTIDSLPEQGALDPTGHPDSYILGSVPNPAGTHFAGFSCSGNPFSTSSKVAPSDPFIHNSRITLPTDNGAADFEMTDRQAVRFEVNVSTTGMGGADLVSVGAFHAKHPKMTWSYKLSHAVNAKYAMRKGIEPLRGDSGRMQVTEFGVRNSDRKGAKSAAAAADFAAAEENRIRLFN